MTSKRFYQLQLSVIVLLCLGLIAGTYAANSMLTARAEKLTSLKAKSQALTQEQQRLTKAKKDVQNYQELYKIAQAVVPKDKNQAQAVREIVKIAADNGVALSSITFPASTLGGGVATTGASTAAATPAATTPVASAASANLSQLQPVKSIPGVYELVITVQSDANRPVRYERFISFLQALERNRRTAQVSNINIEPKADDGSLLSFNLSLKEYIKP